MWILDFIYNPTSPALKFAPTLKEKLSAVERPFQKVHVVQEGEPYSVPTGTEIYLMDFPDTPAGKLLELEEVRSPQMFELLKILFHDEYPNATPNIIRGCAQIIEAFIQQAEEQIPAVVSFCVEQQERYKYPEFDINPIHPKKEYIRLTNGFYKKYKCNSLFGSLTAKVHAACFRMLPFLKELEEIKSVEEGKGEYRTEVEQQENKSPKPTLAPPSALSEIFEDPSLEKTFLKILTSINPPILSDDTMRFIGKRNKKSVFVVWMEELVRKRIINRPIDDELCASLLNQRIEGLEMTKDGSLFRKNTPQTAEQYRTEIQTSISRLSQSGNLGKAGN